MRKLRSWLLTLLAVLATLIGLTLSIGTVQAYDLTVNPTGTTVSQTANYTGVIGGSYRHPSNYRIKSATFSYTGRRQSTGSTSTSDYVYLYYKTCVGCGWNSMGPYQATAGQLSLTNLKVDLTPYGTVVEVAMYLYTNSGVTTDTATATINSVVVDSDPFTPSSLTFSGPGSLRSTITTSGFQTWTSGELVGARRMTGARFITNNIYGTATLQGWNTNTGSWVDLVTRSYTDNVTDAWWDGRSQTTYNITKLRIYHNAATSYGNFSDAYVPQVYYYDTYGTPDTVPDSWYQTTLSWNANGNPAGTTYEIRRKKFNAAGTQVEDLLIGTTTNTNFSTTDLQPGVYYSFRVRAVSGGNSSPDTAEIAYWTPPVPAVARDNAKITVSWNAVYPGLTYWVWDRQAGTNDWSGGWSTTSTSYTIDPGYNSPYYKYEVAITPPGTLPNGGPIWYATDGQQYRPKWQAPYVATVSNVTATTARVWWEINNNSTWIIDTGAPMQITRSDGTNTVTVLNNVNTAASNGAWATPPSNSYGYWGYLDQTGMTPGLTYTYTICALNPDSECGATRQVSVTPKPLTPAAPTLAAAATQNQVTVNWGANGNAAGATYELWRRTLNADGTTALDEKIFSATDTYTYTTSSTYAQSPGRFYKYRVRAVVSGVSSTDTTEVAYWTSPVPSVTRDTGGLNLSWALPQSAQAVSTGTSSRVTSTSCNWYSTNYSLPSGSTNRIRVTFTGHSGDGWGLYVYAPSYGWWWQISQTTVSSALYDQWVDLPYYATQWTVYTHNCGGGTGGSIMEIAQYVAPSSTSVDVAYSANGTTWTNFTTASTATSVTIPATATVSPLSKYQVALTPNTLPNGGTAWRNVQATWYSPLWRDAWNEVTTNVNATSARIWWQINNNSTWAIDSSAPILITRTGGAGPATVLNGVTTAASGGGWATPTGGTYGYWGFVDDTGLTPGVAYTYTLCALNALSECGTADTFTVTPKPLTPTNPTLGTASTQYQVQVNWGQNGNSSGTTYEVWRQTLAPDGSTTIDEKVFSGTDTYTYTTSGTYAQQPGKYYRFRVRTVVGGVTSPDTATVDYWTAPVPSVTNDVNLLNVSWTPPLAAQTISTGGALNTPATNTSTNSATYTVPNSGVAAKLHFTWNGLANNSYYGLWISNPSGSGYWVYSQWTNNSTGTGDTWIDMSPYGGARQVQVYSYSPTSTTMTVNVPELLVSSTTTATVEYSTNGTAWTQFLTGNGSGAATLTAPTTLSPSSKYQIALSPTSVPSGGPTWRAINTNWYSPLWRDLIQNNAGTITQTTAQLWWATGEYSDNTRPSRSSKVQISRNGTVIATLTPGSSLSYSLSTQYGRYDYWASYTDSGLTPGTSYNYSACVLNALDQCGTAVTWTVLTLPPTPDSNLMDVQYGSYGWRTTATGGAWAEISFQTVQSATSYKLYVSGPETRTLTVPAPSTGTLVKFKVSDLISGGSNYAFKVSAVNGSGEGGQSNALTFTTPSRADSAAPTSPSMSINEGAPTTGGVRVKIRGTASDSGSGAAGFQISNDGTTWSATFPLYDPRQINMVVYSGDNSFFTDLGGWTADPNVWAKTVADSQSEQGGRVANIRWDGNATGRWTGLKSANNLAITAGEQYTIAVRYKVTGLTTGQVGIWSTWLNGAVPVADANCVFSQLDGAWRTETCTLTAPAGASGRSLVLGFDQANTGALLAVDWITMNQGPGAIIPVNTLPNPTSAIADWNIDGSSFGTKTVRTRFVDTAGNVSTAISATIQFMLTDTNGPRVSVQINGGAGSTESTTVMLTITATDAESSQEILKMRVSNDGKIFSNWTDYTPTKSWAICTIGASFCEGLRQVWVEVQDPAGNIGSAIGSIFFRVNNQPVTDTSVMWATTGSAGTYSTGAGTINVQFVRLTQITVNLDASKLSGVTTVRFGLDRQRLGQAETLSSSKSLQLANTEGIQTLYMVTDDGRTYQLQFLLDQTPPTVTVGWAGDATATRSGGQATLVIAADDNLARSEDLLVSVNGGAWTAWQPEIPVTVNGNGLVQVTVRVADPGGNIVTRVLSIFRL